MAIAIRQEQRRKASPWHHDFLDQLGVRRADLEKLIVDVRKSRADFDIIAQNKNAHGGFRVSLLGEDHKLASKLRKHVVFKSGDKKEDLEGELRAITLMNATMPDGAAGIQVVAPLHPHVVGSNNGEYHILLHRVHGESVADKIADMNSTESLPLLNRLAEFTAACHARMHIKIKGFHGINEFVKYSTRLQQLAKAPGTVNLPELDDELKQLTGPMRAVYDKFTAVQRYFRKDPTLSNWIVDTTKYSGKEVDKMDMVAIDWEFTREPCPREFELSKLLHQGDHLNRNSTLNGRASKAIIGVYIDAFKEYGGIPVQSKDAFMARVLLADVPKAFAFLAYAFDKPHMHTQIHHYVANAVHSMEVLRDSGAFNGSMARHYGRIIESFRYLDTLVPRRA